MRNLIIIALILGVIGVGFSGYVIFKDLNIGGRVSTSFIDQGDALDNVVNPTNLAAATTTAGSITSTTTLYFKLTSFDYAGGQTEPSNEISCELGPYLTGVPDGCTVTMTPATGAETARLWIATTSETYYAYMTATSSTVAATTTGLTTGAIPEVSTAYLYNTIITGAYLWEHASVDELIKTGPGFVHTVTYSPTDAAATAGKIAILDAIVAGNNATSTLYYMTAAFHEPVTIVLDQYFSTGIYVDFTTTTDVNVSISYK